MNKIINPKDFPVKKKVGIEKGVHKMVIILMVMVLKRKKKKDNLDGKIKHKVRIHFFL